MGENDLRALRFLLKRQSEGVPATPAELGAELHLKSSSVTVMLDRLTIAGWVARQPHPTDRRSLVIVATPGADQEVRHTLQAMHRRMLAAAGELDPREAEVVREFLGRMAAAVESLDQRDSIS
ncbi:MarR family winged helix-turn-helix transcriptional regulator [Leifsonia sp. 22587]|uniref:MarR family winged helix-turn-helix transcriptional regulator n=1 Tax=Leifsonia sp. 22587 TaxID=3453946 RepID=UPI003F87A935